MWFPGTFMKKEEFLQWAEHFNQTAKEFHHLAHLDRAGEENEKSLFELVVSAQSDLVKHRSEEHTSELQSRRNIVCRLLLEKKNKI